MRHSLSKKHLSYPLISFLNRHFVGILSCLLTALKGRPPSVKEIQWACSLSYCTNILDRWRNGLKLDEEQECVHVFSCFSGHPWGVCVCAELVCVVPDKGRKGSSIHRSLPWGLEKWNAGIFFLDSFIFRCTSAEDMYVTSSPWMCFSLQHISIFADTM